jgi:hypothetical protein
MGTIRVCDIPTVAEKAPARAQQRRANGCEFCSNCGHATNESSDQLRPLIPESPLLLPDSMTVLENWPRIVNAIQEGV